MNETLNGKLKFGSTVIYIKDNIKETLDFYSRAFGFNVRYYDDNLRFGELELNETTIMIASYAAGEFMVGSSFREWLSDKPNNVEIAFITDNVAGAYSKAIAAGAKKALEPKTFPWGQEAAYVYIIEGTLIGILTPAPVADK